MWNTDDERDQIEMRLQAASSRHDRLRALLSLAFLSRRAGTQARPLLAQAREIIDGDPDRYPVESCHHDYIDQFILGESGQKIEAVRLCLGLLDNFEQLGDVHGRISTMLSLANYYSELGDQDALKPLLDDLRALDNSGTVPESLRAAVYYSLAHNYLRLEVPEITRSYAKRVLDHENGRFGGLYMLGLAEFDLGQFSRAIDYLKAAEEEGAKFSADWAASASTLTGESYIESGAPDQAIEWLSATLDRHPKLLDISRSGLTHQLGRAHRALGNDQTALEWLQQARDWSDPSTASTGTLAIEQDLAELNYDMGRFRQAADHFHRATTLQTELADRAKRSQETLTAVRHEYELAQQELDFTRSQATALAEANDELTKAIAEQKQILAIVAHDLTSPLTSIQLTAETIGGMASADANPRVHQLTSNIGKGVAHMYQVVAQLTTMARIDSGDIDIDIDTTTLSEAIALSMQRNDGAIKDNEIGVSIDVHADLQVRADVALLGRVLDNMVSNAVKYSPSGSSLSIAARTNRDVVECSVTDQGVGMKPEEMDRLFTKFGRLSSRPQTEAPSTGLGLYIAKKLVSKMGGDITAHSSGPGLGSTFIVTLPGSLRTDMVGAGSS